MLNEQNYRLICRNPNCAHQFHRRFNRDFFDKIQYSSGHSCYDCGFPKMKVIKSQRRIDDGFKPGFQKNLGIVCHTYKQYKDELKIRGLIEMGLEEVKPTEIKTKYFDDDMVKFIAQHKTKDFNFSDNELDAIKDGKIEGIF